MFFEIGLPWKPQSAAKKGVAIVNAITLLLITVCFVIGAAFISIEAVIFGIVFLTAAMLVAISGQSGARTSASLTRSAPYDAVSSQASGAGAPLLIGAGIDSYLAFPNSKAHLPVAEDEKPTHLLKKEVGDDFAVIHTGVAMQAQIDALFAPASDVSAPALAASDAEVLAEITPPHLLG